MRTYKIDKNESTLKNERKTKLKHEINIYIEIKRKEGSDMDRIPAAKALMQCIDTPSQNNIQELNLYREQFDQATRLKDLYFQAIDDNLIENELNLERPRSGCSLF
ncbi:MAG: hypothetical protein HYX60_10525 [Legionella longbeachae]|nr:hypothetical protein [Legionella longbeachae]